MVGRLVAISRVQGRLSIQDPHRRPLPTDSSALENCIHIEPSSRALGPSSSRGPEPSNSRARTFETSGSRARALEPSSSNPSCRALCETNAPLQHAAPSRLRDVLRTFAWPRKALSTTRIQCAGYNLSTGVALYHTLREGVGTRAFKSEEARHTSLQVQATAH